MNLSSLYLALRKRLILLLGFRYRVVTRDGIQLLLDIYNYVDRQVDAFGSYEASQLHLLNSLIGAHGARLFIDVGAHWGLYSLFLRKRHVSLEIHAFEPDSLNLAQLQSNLFLNQWDRSITVHQYAASDHSGRVAFSRYCSENRGRSALEPSGPGPLVDCITLDSVFSATSSIVLAVKIDVEGHELSVLKGMTRLLLNNSCIVQAEVKGSNRQGVDEYMAHHGYCVHKSVGDDIFYLPLRLPEFSSEAPAESPSPKVA